jgi:fructose 1,6-bisphosphatase
MLHPQHGLVEVGEALRCQQWEVVLQGWMRSNGGGYAMRVTVYDGKYTVVTESYFAAELALETRAYVERGRSLEGSSDQDVLESSTAHSSRDRALANPVRKGNNRFG